MGKVTYNQTGYVGSSMSVRAAKAYEDGEKPRSEWSKPAMLAAIQEHLDENNLVSTVNLSKMDKATLFNVFFEYKSWHHVGVYATETDFFGIDEDLFVSSDNAASALFTHINAGKPATASPPHGSIGDVTWVFNGNTLVLQSPQGGCGTLEACGPPENVPWHLYAPFIKRVAVKGKLAATSLSFAFAGCKRLLNIRQLAKLDISECTTLEGTFAGCSSLVYLDALESWDTSRVSSLAETFSSCRKLTDVSALANWDTSSVTSFANTFAGCKSISMLSGLECWGVPEAMVSNEGV